MAMPVCVLSAAVEGIVDEAVLRRLVTESGGVLHRAHGGEGKPALRRSIAGYNNAARFSPWVVLVDLDRDADCVPPFVADWLPDPSPLMRFRVAVRAVEAWLIADRRSIASFLSVPVSRVPPDPDAQPDPKRVLVTLARHSRRRDVREDMVPRDGSGRSVGRAYTSRLVDFVGTTWQPDQAAQYSDSLRRCRQRIAELVALDRDARPSRGPSSG